MEASSFLPKGAYHSSSSTAGSDGLYRTTNCGIECGPTHRWYCMQDTGRHAKIEIRDGSYELGQLALVVVT